jgi:hypothetical protein
MVASRPLLAPERTPAAIRTATETHLVAAHQTAATVYDRWLERLAA